MAQKLAAFAVFAAKASPVLFRNALVVGGFYAVLHGVARIYPPAAWVLGGVFAMLSGFALSRSAS